MDHISGALVHSARMHSHEVLALLVLVCEGPPVPQLVALCLVMPVELLAGPGCELNS